MGACCGKRTARRLLRLTAAAVLGSLVFSASAFAQGGLGSITNAVLPETGTSLDKAVDDNLEAPTPVLDTASPAVDAATPVLETADPVVDAAAPVVQNTATPVLQAAAPVLEAAAPVLETTAPVVQAAATVAAPLTQPVSDVTASTLDTATAVVQTAGLPAAVSGPVSGDAAPTAPESTAVDAAASVAVPNGTVDSPADRDRAASSRSNSGAATPQRGGDVRRNAGAAGTGSQSLLATSVDNPWSQTPDASKSRPAPSAKELGSPSRHGPSLPATPSSISAGSFGGGALLVLAVLGALFLLAAPGMGRRLRLMLALPPLPVALSPLERPG